MPLCNPIVKQHQASLQLGLAHRKGKAKPKFQAPCTSTRSLKEGRVTARDEVSKILGPFFGGLYTEENHILGLYWNWANAIPVSSSFALMIEALHSKDPLEQG